MDDTHSAPVNLQPLAEIDQVVHGSARLMILCYLYVVESVDYVLLAQLTGLSWGNLSTHLSKLEQAGYVDIEKGYRDRKPRSVVHLTDAGRVAFREYKSKMQRVLDDLPD